ncbi:MAG: hypothetical protein EBT06_08045 [Gammaproteobacteria bacterium]|nr:hypothetical protein [Gammaproteobacteria bacterium]NBT44858.1 hypothetical protein [Gammaproteobacteria bacterium]NBY23437.1 hypothetical protein [Gammaproteobacteria bacterium]
MSKDRIQKVKEGLVGSRGWVPAVLFVWWNIVQRRGALSGGEVHEDLGLIKVLVVRLDLSP